MKEAYISTPIKLEKKSRIVQEALESIEYKVNNPCDIDDAHGDPKEIPKRVFDGCITMMDNSDIVVLILDYFGIDCAAEIGYTIGNNKPIYGVYVDKKNAVPGCLDDLKHFKESISKTFNNVEEMKTYLKNTD